MIAFVFPGQGCQYVGMGKDLYESFIESRRVFDEADRILQYPLTRLCFEGPLKELSRTINCQPAIFTVSLAALAAFNKKISEEKRQVMPKYFAGLSLGEYTALVAAGALSFEDGISLVAKRAKFMEEAALINPGKMSSILGLDLSTIKDIAQKSGAYIANLNCPGQIVLSGSIEAIDKANELALSRGAKRVVNLQISGASHCPLMQPATVKLAEALKHINIKEPKAAIVSNVSASAVFNIEQIKENLVRQLISSVRWEESIRFMLKEGVDTFFEIGPGKVLRGLIRKIDANAQVVNIGGTEDINKF